MPRRRRGYGERLLDVIEGYLRRITILLGAILLAALILRLADRPAHERRSPAPVCRQLEDGSRGCYPR